MTNEPMRDADGKPVTLFGLPVVISDDPELKAANEALKGATLMSLEQWEAKRMTQPRDEGTLPARAMEGDAR